MCAGEGGMWAAARAKVPQWKGDCRMTRCRSNALACTAAVSTSGRVKVNSGRDVAGLQDFAQEDVDAAIAAVYVSSPTYRDH